MMMGRSLGTLMHWTALLDVALLREELLRWRFVVWRLHLCLEIWSVTPPVLRHSPILRRDRNPRVELLLGWVPQSKSAHLILLAWSREGHHWPWRSVPVCAFLSKNFCHHQERRWCSCACERNEQWTFGEAVATHICHIISVACCISRWCQETDVWGYPRWSGFPVISSPLRGKLVYRFLQIVCYCR